MMKKRIFLIISIILIIAVLITAIIYYYGYYTKPEQTYKRLIRNVFDNNKILKNINYDTYKCDVKLDVDVQDSSNELNKDILDIINNLNTNVRVQMNKKDKQLLIDLKADYNNNDLLNLETCTNIDKKETYICLKDFLNKYLRIEINDKFYILLEEAIKTNSEDNIKILKNELINLVNKEECSSIKEKILIEDKLKKVTKDTIKIKGKDLLDILKIVYENIETIEGISKYKEAEIKIDIYTTGILKNKVEKVNITIINSKDIINLTIVDNIYYYEFINDGKTFTGNISFQKQSENNGKLNLILETEQLGKLTLKVDYTVEYDTKLELINIINSTAIDSLTKDEQVIILENFKKSNLYNLIKNIIVNKEDE